MYFVYILLCFDNTLYCGITNNLQKRLNTHESGKGAKYVRARLPVKMIYTEKVENKSLALKREFEIKSWSRNQKIKNLKLEV
jgi:putative endonuclease